MDWTHTFTIIGALGVFMIYVLSRTDKRIDDLKTEIKDLDKKIGSTEKTLSNKIETVEKTLNDKIETVQKDINQIGNAISNIEGQITQMTRPGIIPIERYQQQHTLPPEDENGSKKAQGQ